MVDEMSFWKNNLKTHTLISSLSYLNISEIVLLHGASGGAHLIRSCNAFNLANYCWICDRKIHFEAQDKPDTEVQSLLNYCTNENSRLIWTPVKASLSH